MTLFVVINSSVIGRRYGNVSPVIMKVIVLMGRSLHILQSEGLITPILRWDFRREIVMISLTYVHSYYNFVNAVWRANEVNDFATGMIRWKPVL